MKKVDLEVYGMSAGRPVSPILAVVTNPDGTPIGGSGGGGGEAVTGQVRLNAPAMPEGTKTLQTLGEFGQPIVEVVIYNPDTGIGATLKQPLTNEESRQLIILPAGVNKSGSITTGGTAKVLAALNASRKSLTIQNTSTGDLFINEHGTATANGNSFILEPKASANIQTRNAISVLGMTTGQTWAATETSV